MKFYPYNSKYEKSYSDEMRKDTNYDYWPIVVVKNGIEYRLIYYTTKRNEMFEFAVEKFIDIYQDFKNGYLEENELEAEDEILCEMLSEKITKYFRDTYIHETWICPVVQSTNKRKNVMFISRHCDHHLMNHFKINDIEIMILNV